MPPTIIELDDNDDDHSVVQILQIALEEEIADIIDLGEESLLSHQHSVSLRNPPIRPIVRFSSYRHKSFLIKKGTIVEVPRRSRKELSWQFLEVSDIYRKGEMVILRGVSLTRQRYLNGMLQRLQNEVCAVLEVEKDDSRDWEIQAAVEVSVTEVIRIRQLRKTNALYPTHKVDDSAYLSTEAIETFAPLVQRWVFVKFYNSARFRREHRSVSGMIRRLDETEIKDPILRVSNNSLRNTWRGGIVPGGSFRAGQEYIPTIEADETPDTRLRERTDQQRYSAGDFFCGAGGASLGMRKGGFEVVLACDMDPAACKTYHTNFPRSDLREMHVHDFVRQQNESKSKHHTDVLHISPPCQVWSPAHTIAGQNDAANMAALFSCGDIVNKVRPRITTGEQTFGILFGRFREYFNSLIFQYTSLGYSFEWNILNLSHYGLVQPRKRAIWIASCPGEALPPFPAPTHIEKPVTVRQVLQRVNPNTSLHNLSETYGGLGFPKPAYDDRAPLRHTITTGCFDNYHPSGLRNFTIHELALLQGFPRDYRFKGNRTQVKRQIGNAFPASVAKTLYRHIHEWLLQQDGIVEQVIDIDDPIPPAIRTKTPQEAIVIDDSSEDEIMELDNNDVMRLSRESSRTLSVGSDQEDMDIDFI